MKSSIVSNPEPDTEDQPDPALSGQGLKVFPNPTAGKFTLWLNAPVGDQPCFLQITGILGNQVINQQLEGSDQFEIDLSGQNPGIYIIRLIRGDLVEKEKLVKQ